MNPWGEFWKLFKSIPSIIAMTTLFFFAMAISLAVPVGVIVGIVWLVRHW